MEASMPCPVNGPVSRELATNRGLTCGSRSANDAESAPYDSRLVAGAVRGGRHESVVARRQRLAAEASHEAEAVQSLHAGVREAALQGDVAAALLAAFALLRRNAALAAPPAGQHALDGELHHC